MALDQLETILKNHRLRQTHNRTAILDIFVTKEGALSHSDIEGMVEGKIDRVTIYRTLKSFLDHGIIHKVLDDMGSAKYAICKDTCLPHDHHHNHVHFKCHSCGQTQCLEDLSIPQFQLPEGYVAKEMDLLIQGVCHNCEEN
ncbi:MAG TPA: transcriptional repressor [Cytophagales bacterium]|nr:transcriptional repressor [Cytophagales bacterium]HAA23397.1 transcriptional repressor [Cytophagales bacterium]HAP58122.1 transcriptional repressor [Cytophagales bacterium]